MCKLAELTTLTNAQLDIWVEMAKTHTQGGQLPNYIPLLAKANPSWLAVQIEFVDGQIRAAGNANQPFPLMSIIKPFLLLFLFDRLGSKAVFNRVGMEPSDQPFNSLNQLEADAGWPRNPMINSGAIALSSLLPGSDGASGCENLRQWLNQSSGAKLFLDQQMLASVREAGGATNRAIASVLVHYGYLDAPETALDTYNQICCLSGTVSDLARLGMLLAQDKRSIQPEHRRTVNAIMMTCGLYQASAQFAVRIGLPSKSGVSGALLSVVPSQGAIALFSPPLDEMGNSKAGLFLLEQLTQTLNLSVFD